MIDVELLIVVLRLVGAAGAVVTAGLEIHEEFPVLETALTRYK